MKKQTLHKLAVGALGLGTISAQANIFLSPNTFAEGVSSIGDNGAIKCIVENYYKEVMGEDYTLENNSELDEIWGDMIRGDMIWGEMQKIKTLECQNYNISWINLSVMPLLENVNLSKNNISNLDVLHIDGLGSLKEINLSENHLKKADFSSLTEETSRMLNKINLSSNEISDFKLPNNRVTNFDINLSNNKITSENFHSFFVTDNIKNLNLSNNKLTGTITVPTHEGIKDYTNVTLDTLNVNSNELSKIDITAAGGGSTKLSALNNKRGLFVAIDVSGDWKDGAFNVDDDVVFDIYAWISFASPKVQIGTLFNTTGFFESIEDTDAYEYDEDEGYLNITDLSKYEKDYKEIVKVKARNGKTYSLYIPLEEHDKTVSVPKTGAVSKTIDFIKSNGAYILAGVTLLASILAVSKITAKNKAHSLRHWKK